MNLGKIKTLSDPLLLLDLDQVGRRTNHSLRPPLAHYSLELAGSGGWIVVIR